MCHAHDAAVAACAEPPSLGAADKEEIGGVG
jgi:hypothetical protein